MSRFRYANLSVKVDVALSIERLGLDIRYALRQLITEQGFSIAIVLTLALAIGVNTSVFTLVHTILLRQLPFDDPDQVFLLKNGSAAGIQTLNGGKDYRANFQNAANSFRTVESAAIYASSGVNADLSAEALPSGATALRLRVCETSVSLFDVLGVKPQYGRAFSTTEDISGNDHVVLIGDSLWRSAFAADPKAIGTSIRLNGMLFIIIGVMPPRMDFPAQTDLWTPTVFDNKTSLRESGAFFTPIVLRSKPGVSVDQLRSEFHARATRPPVKVAPDRMPELTPIAAELTKSIRTALLLVTGAVTLVLLIACANIAGLMLVRATTRRTEFAVRTALGAPRGRLVRLPFLESLFLALGGGLLGIFVAHVALQALVFRPADALASFEQPHIDGAVLAFTAAIAIFTGIAFGVAPAWLAAHEDPISALKTGAGRTSRSTTKLRKTLVIAQMGLAFVLLTGAGLLLRTLANLNAVPLGYNTEGILSFSISPHPGPQSKANTDTALASFYAIVLDRLRALPGVDAVAAIDMPPLDIGRADMLVSVTSSQMNPKASHAAVSTAPRFASPGYFSLMGIALQQGREFGSQDTQTSKPAIIVTRDLADHLWPGEDPLGRQLHCEFFCEKDPTVIGVVSPSRNYGPIAESLPEFYFSTTQSDWTVMTFLVRTQQDPAQLAGPVRKAVAAVDPTQPIYDIRTMRQRLNDNEALPRFELFTLSIFAVLATLLAILGLYGIISYSVTQRTRDIGIRIALGSSLGRVRISVLREAALLALTGATLGLVASQLLSRLLAATLFQVSAHDPLTLVSIFVIFLIVSVGAALLPANRASSIDPMKALRHE